MTEDTKNKNDMSEKMIDEKKLKTIYFLFIGIELFLAVFVYFAYKTESEMYYYPVMQGGLKLVFHDIFCVIILLLFFFICLVVLFLIILTIVLIFIFYKEKKDHVNLKEEDDRVKSWEVIGTTIAISSGLLFFYFFYLFHMYHYFLFPQTHTFANNIPLYILDNYGIYIAIPLLVIGMPISITLKQVLDNRQHRLTD